MSNQINDSIYKESTVAQLLKPRVDLLTKNGGLNYFELNKRILADNVTENIKNDHNPIYGGINREVCAIERQESFTISDNLESFDKTYYTIIPRKVFIKTSDTTVVTEASGFFGDNLTINANKIIDLMSSEVLYLDGVPVDGEFSLDKTKLIIDESFNNPWNIDFSDETSIKLTINPLKQNVIPLIFTPLDKKLKQTFFNISLLVLDEREKAVIPELSNGLYIKISELNASNATSFKNKKGELKVDITGVIEGSVLNSKTKEELESVTCTVLSGNSFPEMPTNFDMSGTDDVSKHLHTLYANVKISQSSIRDLNTVLPVVFLEDNREDFIPIASIDFKQNANVNLTYSNSGNTFKGEACILDSSTVSSSISVTAKDIDDEDVDLVIGNTVVEKSLNKNQSSSKATVSVTDNDNRVSTLKYSVDVTDSRPLKAKENFKATEDFSVTITSSDFNAGIKGQDWTGDSLEIDGTLSKIENQFGKVILPSDILYYSFNPIDVNARILEDSDKNPIQILSSDGSEGSTEGKAKLYVLLKDFSVIELDVDISVTDERQGDSPSPSSDFVKIITDSFEVTNDGGSTMKEAYSVAEIKKDDWEYLKSQFSPSTYTLILSNQGDTWSGTIACMGLDTCMILMSEDIPTEEHPDPHCSFTTIGARVFTQLGEEVPLPSGGTITIKTYIDGEENSDDTYRPAAAGTSQTPAHVEGEEPVVEDWLWETEAIGVSEHSPLIYKMAVLDIDPAYESLIKGVSSWNMAFTYREVDNVYIVAVVKTIDGVVHGASLQNTGSGYKTSGQPLLLIGSDTVGSVSIKAFDYDTGEAYDEDTFLPMGTRDFNTTMTKI